MQFSHLKVDNFRNFSNLSLDFNPRFNLFYGENGSGKTSLLEILYFFSFGKSFRSCLNKHLIKDSHHKFTLFSKIISENNSQYIVGVEKDSNGNGDLKLLGQTTSLAELSALLPIIVLNNDSFALLNNGPMTRRQFLDWGVFHVKHSFLAVWREYMRALKQRNNAIKAKLPISQIQNWDATLISAGNILTELRQEYTDIFIKEFQSILSTIFQFPDLTVKFFPGWPSEASLADKLAQNLQRDLELGYTYYGSHRADIKLAIKGKPIEDVLSRGQQKIVVWLMRLTQSIILNNQTEKKPIILIDDIGAELDVIRKQALIKLFNNIEAQYFITAIEQTDLAPFITSQPAAKVFHVKHDSIYLITSSTY